jgi:single-strand DNA-binding protein
MNINTVVLAGRLMRDPELGALPSGDPVCELRLAVGAGNSAKDPTVYIDVVAFEKTAQACAQHLAKGREIGVTGRLTYREWAGADGTKRSRHRVVATRVELGSRPRGGGDELQEAEARETAF